MTKKRLERLDASAQLALTLAREEALRLNHNYIGTEHLLLGLLRETDGVAAKALGALGVGLTQSRETVKATMGMGEEPPAGEIGLTPRGWGVLKIAVKEARRASREVASSEHLLLALVRDGDGMAAAVLGKLGVSAEQVREAVADSGEGASRESGGAGARSNVVMCRLDDYSLGAIDTLIEAGIRSTRSDAASWLIRAGIDANEPLFETMEGTVAEIRRLRERAKEMAEHAASASAASH